MSGKFVLEQREVDFSAPLFYGIDQWVGRDGAWVRLVQEQSGRPVATDLHVAELLQSLGRAGHFVGSLGAPESLRLIASFDAAVPIGRAVQEQLLAPCAAALGQCLPQVYPLGGFVPKDVFAPRGPVIGAYKGAYIHDTLTSEGQEFEYDRIAQESRGLIRLEQLDEGEIVVPPGLIYRPRGG